MSVNQHVTDDVLPTVSALVPTYRRVDDLRRCVAALLAQSRPPSEIVVVARPEDAETWRYLEALGETSVPVRPVEVIETGQVKAINAGLDAVSSDIVAITDDDAIPRPQWIEKIARAFGRDGRIGGVGGRDVVHHGDEIEYGARETVGRVPRFGKMTGNHHLGIGDPRFVDVLKGVNGSYRTAALRDGTRLDLRLRGTGAQTHWEVGLGIRLRRAGWKLLYDPSILVDHHVAQRFDEDQRTGFSVLAMRNNAFNETLLRAEHLGPFSRFAYAAIAIAFGTRAAPGMLQALRFLPTQPRVAIPKAAATIRGILDALAFISNARG